MNFSSTFGMTIGTLSPSQALSTFHSTSFNIVARNMLKAFGHGYVERCWTLTFFNDVTRFWKNFAHVQIFVQQSSTFILILLTVGYVECVWSSLTSTSFNIVQQCYKMLKAFSQSFRITLSVHQFKFFFSPTINFLATPLVFRGKFKIAKNMES